MRSEQTARMSWDSSTHIFEDLNSDDVSPSDLFSWSKRRKQMLRWLNSLHHEAKTRDLIIVPSRGYTTDNQGHFVEMNTLIGEIAGRNRRWFPQSTSRFYPRSYIVRDVRWITTINEFEMHKQTVVSLRTQNAIIPLDPAHLYPVLGEAYQNVSIGDEYFSRFLTSGSAFDANESFHFQAFCMAVVAALSEREEVTDLFTDGKSIYDIAASVSQSDAIIPEQITNIRSPGYTMLRSKNLSPLVIAVLFSLALGVGSELYAKDGPKQINVINSLERSEETCNPDVEEAVMKTLRIMGIDRWREACKAAIIANDDQGLQPAAKVMENDG